MSKKPQSLSKNSPPNDHELIRFFRWSWEQYQAIQSLLPTHIARFATAYEDPFSENQLAVQLRYAVLRKYFAPTDQLSLEHKVIPALIRVTKELKMSPLDIESHVDELKSRAELINKNNRPSLAYTSFNFPETPQDQIDRVMYGGLLHGDFGKWEFIYGSRLRTVAHQNLLFQNQLTQELWVQNFYLYTQSIQDKGLMTWEQEGTE